MILQRYILRELLLSFGLAFGAVMGVCMMATLLQLFRNFEGLGLSFVLQTIPMAAGYVTPWALLTASCTAATLVYGRLSAENELDAMRMSGIHANRMLAPAILFGLGLCATAYFVVEHVSPVSHYHRRKMVRESLFNILKAPPPGKQEFKFGSYLLMYTDCRDGRMENLYVIKHGLEWLEFEYRGKSGHVVLAPDQPPQLVIAKPHVVHYSKGTISRFDAESDVTIPLQLEGGFDQEKGPADMSATELLEESRRTKEPRRRAEALTTFYSRFAQALAPMLLVLVSVPVGIFVKRGSKLAGLGASLPPLILYFVLFSIFQGMGEKGKVAPAVAAFVPDATLLVASLVLLWRVYRR